ncbi:MAG: carbon-nitrogen hydrolase family protein, partial [Anaerolineae bacterium]
MIGQGFDQEANRAKGEAFCRQAAAQGADIALFPEMWNIGYTFYDPASPDTLALWKAQAIGRDSPFVAHFSKLACELNMALGLTFIEQHPGRPRNTMALIDRRGEIVLTYSKVHTCEFDVECALEPGDDFEVCDLDTAAGPVRIGAMICYDREFPESARVLMLKGAEIILTPNACEMEIHRTSQFRTRAMENMVGVALANYAGPPHNGRSVAYSPI